jgi:disulfide bond formation protein DsbB
MPTLSLRTLALLSALGAGAALASALAIERWGGLAPCALCLLERWPYRVSIVVALLAVIVPPPLARALLLLVVLTLLADVALAFIHVGVEAHWWNSPLPECVAPQFIGGSITERLAHMPATPAKPCDDPSYLFPGVPVSLAAMNLAFALAFAVVLAIFLWRSDRRPA